VFDIQNSLMTKSFLTHLAMIGLLHGLLLFGGWHFFQDDLLSLPQVGEGIVKLKLASEVIRQSTIREKKKTPLPVPEDQSLPSVREEVPTAATTEGAHRPKVGKASALKLYEAEVRSMIERNKSYPAMSKRLGHKGTVVVAFTLQKDGSIINLRIAKPSRFDRLDEAALDAVKKVKRFKPFPDEEGFGETMELSVPLNFKII
jgi:TonB family protein